MTPRILIAGIGNIFLGDDAFGVEVVRHLVGRTLPEGVRVVDFGIRGLDLTYALLDGCDAAILVDAAPRGHPPGTLFVIEPSPQDIAKSNDVSLQPGEMLIDMHGMDPVRVLRLVKAMGGQLRQIFVVGCEPTPLASEEDMEVGLSDPVRRTVVEAVPMIESLISKILEGEESAVAMPRV